MGGPCSSTHEARNKMDVDRYGYINKLDAKLDIRSATKIGEESCKMKMFTEVHVYNLI